ncbi:MAG: SLBB domain-containing protein, partial [Tannerellaceae bacterium]|nr:SLBB domain-containing protein [Tannerellaceae bacterium]
QAQIPQDLLDKARAMRITDSQTQEELSKQGMSLNDGSVSAFSNGVEAKITDRTISPVIGDILSLEIQQEQNLPEDDLEYTVFGREIFSNKYLTFAPDLNVPTPKNYRLASGDELLINVWGDSELNLELTVSPDGTIIIPNLGPIKISGLTVEAAENKIRMELGRIMSDIVSGDAANTFVSVSLGQIRSIKVHIVGEVMAPGTYTLNSFATLFNALYASGGVNDIGSLRSIKLFRNSKEIANLDVYDYLLNGRFETNVRLEDNDMIMVDTYDQLVTITGKVKQKRIFELRQGETLKQLLEMAGGFAGDAYREDIRVNRKSGRRYQIATVKEKDFGSFVMHDGDFCVVDSVIPFYENRLIITGTVWRPGEYELNEQVHTVKQLIDQAAGVKGDEFTGRAQLTRLNPDFTSTLIGVDIKGILNGTSPDIELHPKDQLHIPSLFDLRGPYTIKVSGAVNYSDIIFPYQYNMTIEDAIILAGGLKESAATINVEVARRIKDPTSSSVGSRIAKEFNFTLTDDFQLCQDGTIFTLEPFDEVYVRFSPGYQEQQVVKISGEVAFAGNYVLAEKNARLSDIILKAGGVTSDAYIKGASLKRLLTDDEMRRIETLLELSTGSQGRDSVAPDAINLREYSVGIDLEKALAKPGSAHDVVLQDGDELFIPQLQSTVKVSGSVTYPNSVTYTKGVGVRGYLSQAGGYNDLSRKYPIVVYMNGKVATTKRTGVFFKKYPKVEPGCEILVPTKIKGQRMSMAEVLSMSSTSASLAAMIISIVNTISKD